MAAKIFNKNKHMTLEEIENKLKTLLTREKHQWTKTAQLLIEVDRNKLYRTKTKFFTQYLRQLAYDLGIHESNLWRIKKAGEYYLKLHNTDDCNVIQEATASPEQIEILLKISTVAPPDIVQHLEEKVITGETTRDELREIWKNYRPIREGKTERGGKPQKPLNKEDEYYQLNLFNQSTKTVKVTKSTKTKLVTINIIEALKNPQWAIDTLNINNLNDFHIFNEVAIKSGSSRNPRRIDVVGMLKEPQELLPTVIGVEIKASIHDLKRDMKFTEYMPFCHYFYLAVPNEQAMIEAAASVITPDIGILCITDKVVDGRYQVVIIKKARLSDNPNSTLLGEVYGKCICHALGWIGEG
jgi:hypothetical protein